MNMKVWERFGTFDDSDEPEKTTAGSESVLSDLLDVDYENLKHMTGCDSRYPKKQWGFRNHFAPGGKDIESMERLEFVGHVIRGNKYYDTNYFHATESGCKAIGMKPMQIKNALNG